MATITHDKAIEMIKAMVKEKGSQREVAKALDIGDAYLSDILKGARPISDRIAQKLGYRRVVVYEKVSG